MFAVLLITLVGFGHAMDTFDDCLKVTPKCSSLGAKKTNSAPKKLKSFLSFVTSDVEKAKYECVKKHKAKEPLEKSCSSAIKHYEVHSSCNKDILRFCQWVTPGKQRIKSCLMMNQKRVTKSCKKQLNREPSLAC